MENSTTLMTWMRDSAVGRASVRRLHSECRILDSGPTQTKQGFHPSVVGELVQDLSAKNKAVTCFSAVHRKSLYRANATHLVSPTSSRSGMHGAS